MAALFHSTNSKVGEVMSLDISLTEGEKTERECPTCHGHGMVAIHPEPDYEANITHNLSPMAREAGIYEAIWEPERLGIERAEQLVPYLTGGIAMLEGNPERFKKFNAENGWGTYDQLLGWLVRYLNACRKYPKAKVWVSR